MHFFVHFETSMGSKSYFRFESMDEAANYLAAFEEMELPCFIRLYADEGYTAKEPSFEEGWNRPASAKRLDDDERIYTLGWPDLADHCEEMTL